MLMASERLPDAEISVLLIGDRAMRTLNRRYRGKDRTTDVLSFPLREGKFSRVQHHLLGDIVISVPAAARQARAAGEALPDEIDRLLVHGFLHLLGYDHERGGVEARRMEARERRLRRTLQR
jgi:probable rRNA maturation factor